MLYINLLIQPPRPTRPPLSYTRREIAMIFTGKCRPLSADTLLTHTPPHATINAKDLPMGSLRTSGYRPNPTRVQLVTSG